MAIYDGEGNQLARCYDGEGNQLAYAYDGEGNIIYRYGAINLKVMTYNVGDWYIGTRAVVPSAKDADYLALHTGIFARQDVDILGIEEYKDMFSDSGRTALSVLQTYFPYIHTAHGSETGDKDHIGRAICSKFPIISYTENVYADDTVGRYYDKATLNIYGLMVDVIVTHLHPSDIPEKIRTAKILFDYTETLTNPWIVCGDFNSTLYEPFSETNAAIYNQFLNAGDSIANAGDFGILPTACNSTDWANESFAIDQIITSPTITIDSIATDLTKTTDAITDKIDHVPFMANVTIPLN